MTPKKLLFILLISISFFACEKTTDNTPVVSKLVSSSSVAQYTQAEFADRLKKSFGSQGAQVVLFVRSGIKQYKISYNTTTPDGRTVQASGAIIVPSDIKEAMALASYQHGTIFTDAEAPSYFNEASEATIGSFLASTGFIIAMPDYLGYGDSKSVPHPYEHKVGLSQPTVDFLLAVKDFLKKEKINWNNNLLLGGYSEGGYATLATTKLIEEKYSSDFNLKAVSCGAGAYNKTATINNFLKNKTSGEIVNNRSYLWVLDTYNKLANINRTWADYLIEPYASDVAKNFLKVSINKSFDEILRPTFKDGILNKTDMAWVAALKENDLLDWKANTTIKFFHGDKDTYVPFLNSETTAASLIAKGSTKVSLQKIAGGDHSSSIGDFYLGTLDLFNSNKN